MVGKQMTIQVRKVCEMWMWAECVAAAGLRDVDSAAYGKEGVMQEREAVVEAVLLCGRKRLLAAGRC
jgi:hypothetical protein